MELNQANTHQHFETKNIRILREDPNSINRSSQFVTLVNAVNFNTALIFESYKKGRISLKQAQYKIDQLSIERTEVPFSVYVNVHANHASVFFIQTDLLNRKDGSNLDESNKLAQMKFGLRVFFCENSLQIINPIKVQRVDLFTEDGKEYKIEKSAAFLKPGIYKMFKCYETIGISDYDIEWAILMAAHNWYDTAANNCLSYSKRIIQELHCHIMDEDISPEELKKLNKLYISVPGEASFEIFNSRVSFFLTPSLQPFVLVLLLMIFIAVYVEIRMRFQ